MALREIIVLPDKRLRQVSDPVKAVDAELRTLVDDMFETMYKAPGVGLAAVQVGVPHRGECESVGLARPSRGVRPSRAARPAREAATR